ncbi:MAG: hypothetical protein ACPGRD_06020 [Planktomarina sp.]
MALALPACQTQAPPPVTTPFGTYLGVQTRLLDGDLVNFDVKMRGQLTKQSLVDYAECVAAQYTLVRGFHFARHLRTNVTNEGGNWQADAIYTISSAIPRGLRTIEAEVTVADCKERGIPTV